ncbi:MAG TPA: DUF6134 family protein [Alphaproteobacteria bacterium]|nr:DUF6134 family protein [Alphaproteobacteria bacterium]
MIELWRRLMLISIAGLPWAGGAAAADAETVPAAISFVVNRDGTPIGTHRVSFHTEPGPDGERLIVDIDINITVKAAFVTLYRYGYTCRETWKGGRLLALEATTNDDGKKTVLHVRATEAGLEVDGPDAHYVARPDTLPDSYWHPDTIKHRHFIDGENGKPVDLISTPAGHRTITVDGRPIELALYQLSGETTGEIGYGPGGQWLALREQTHGSDILYVLQPR